MDNETVARGRPKGSTTRHKATAAHMKMLLDLLQANPRVKGRLEIDKRGTVSLVPCARPDGPGDDDQGENPWDQTLK